MVSKPAFELSGGRLCLDLVNMVESRPAEPRELLKSYVDLLAWSRQAGIVSRSEATALARRARARPREAEAALARAIQLREALFEIFSSSRPSAFEILAAEIPSAFRRPSLRSGSSCELVWEDDPKALDRVLGPVIRSAVGILISGEVDRVRVCAAPDCDWLFLDETRNRSRHWCSMKSCGNRSKARRFYRRKRALKRRAGAPGRRRSAGRRERPSRE